MMDDQFMHGLRAAPPAAFAKDLRERLKYQERAEPSAHSFLQRRRVAFGAAAAVLMVALFALPSVRASAQQFLNLFRVVNFTAVPVNVDRLNQLSRDGLDIGRLIGEQVQVLAEPGPAQIFATPADAAAAAGVSLRMPAAVPSNLTLVRIEVEGARSARVTANTRKLQDVLDALGIADVGPPSGLDGQMATLHVPPVMRVVYANGDREVSFLHARSPEVALPAGLNLPLLGEIGLRIMGLDRVAAHTLAQAIDWRGTLVLPVPARASSFRRVDIRGNRGLFVESTERRDLTAVAWSDGGSVFGMTGSVNGQVLLQMADSVQ
jgi:hypothetical protein